jgi:adenosylcobyric acid synthase
MTAKTLMIMGTHSNAGKSILVTALCRIFAQEGYRVAPFKAQNMALNAGVTPEGHEIGRATIAQAEAAGQPPHADMNPILLKPEGNQRSQVVLNGRHHTHLEAANWLSLKSMLWPHVTAALERLRAKTDLVIIEGAGSPAEINLKEGDIVNMRVAQHARSPVLLVGDIDRGGVFAALVGTMVLLEPEERALVKGFVINKFRGDISLLGNGLAMLQERAFNTPTLGVVPFLPEIGVAEEDSVALEVLSRGAGGQGSRGEKIVDIAVIRLPCISNFDDFDPLAAEPGVRLRFVERLDDLSRPAAVILPGSKMTLADLAWLRQTGLAEQIVTLAQAGTVVVGICGGYQMLGQSLLDPNGVEAEPGALAAGLGLLPVETVFAGDKRTVQVQATIQAETGPLAVLRGAPIRGYEIHMGRSHLLDPAAPHLSDVGPPNNRHADGTLTGGGRIWGTYLHGLFDNDALRHAWLASLGWQGRGQPFDRQLAYNRLADHVRTHLDMEALREIIWGKDEG